MVSTTEENYLKAIFKISERSEKSAKTSAIAEHLETTPASVTDMLKKLSDKGLLNYEKYRGVTLTQEGIKVATEMVRKHRLWEVFLVEKLRFSWDKIHDIAEELEHVNSSELIQRLDAFLDYPKFDPHGDPIPNAHGKFTIRNQTVLSDMHEKQKGIVIGVKEHSTPFLQHLNKIKIKLGTFLEIQEVNSFDGSMAVLADGKIAHTFSKRITDNLLIKIQ